MRVSLSSLCETLCPLAFESARGTATGARGAPARRAYSAADFEEEGGCGAASWPYALQSALDAEVCKRAAVFAGTSWSFFSNHVAKGRARQARPSYVYNLPGGAAAPVMVLRTDSGELFEPHDATRAPSALLVDEDPLD